MSEKQYIGKYVCYGQEDGSFSWGRIKDEGTVNTPKGEREVFVLDNRLTCRVAKSEMERFAFNVVDRKICEGIEEPLRILSHRQTSQLPSYQRFCDCKKLPKATEKPPASNLPAVSTPEGRGIVPALEDEMSLTKTKGLEISQWVGRLSSKFSGRTEDIMVRAYGYDTNVRKDEINIETDLVDREEIGFDGLSEEELFLLAMQAKMEDVVSGLNRGVQNILILQSGGRDEDVEQSAIDALKRKNPAINPGKDDGQIS